MDLLMEREKPKDITEDKDQFLNGYDFYLKLNEIVKPNESVQKRISSDTIYPVDYARATQGELYLINQQIASVEDPEDKKVLKEDVRKIQNRMASFANAALQENDFRTAVVSLDAAGISSQEIKNILKLHKRPNSTWKKADSVQDASIDPAAMTELLRIETRERQQAEKK